MAFDVNAAQSPHRDGLTSTVKSVTEEPPEEPIPIRGHQWKVHGVYQIILTWLALCHVAGIVLFSRGFLLNRSLSEEQSTLKTPVRPYDSAHEWPANYSHGCWHPQTFAKAVILVVDALRYDFVAPVEKGDAIYDSRYHNRLQSIQRALKERSRNALLYEFIADPPTTTLQRLTALTTGTLPTFIDAGSNFGGQAITEDSLLNQLKLAGRRVAFSGDDTWTALYPLENNFFESNLTFPFPSFDVHDLHTVDKGVGRQLKRFLKSSSGHDGGWDVVIAHMLGLDHAGHRYGTEHEAFSSKLDEIDAVVEDAMSNLSPDTLLVVLGDHGMTPKGDHGGDSLLETNAALFLFSSGQQLTTPSISLANTRNRQGAASFREGILSRVTDASSVHSGLLADSSKPRSAFQIDLVPSLSLLLGLPIPFNNLGSVIPELFFQASWALNMGQARKSGFGHWETVLRAVRVNSYQIRRFVKSYLTHNKVTSANRERLRAIDQDFQRAEKLWKKALNDDHMSDERASDSFVAFEDYNRKALHQARMMWARFDNRMMYLGVSLLASSFVFSVIMIFTGWPLQADQDAVNPFAAAMIALGGASGLIVGNLWWATGISNSIVSSTEDTALARSDVLTFATAAASLAGMFAHLAWTNRPAIRIQDSMLQTILALLCTLLYASTGFSNSFIIHEDRVILFLLATCAIIGLKSMSFFNTKRARRGLGFCLAGLVLSRCISLYRVCRDEQGSLCSVTYYSSEGSATASNHVFVINILLAVYLFPLSLGRTLGYSRSHGGFALELTHVGSRLLAFCALGYWILDTYSTALGIEERIAQNYKMLSSLFMIFFTLIAIGIWSNTPLLIDIMEHKASIGANKTVVLGWSNALGAPLLLFQSILTMVLAFVQKPAGWLALVVGFGQVCCLLEMADTIHDVYKARRLLENPKPTGITQPSLFASVVLALCGCSWFFATGHQATFSSIQWDSAFIGLGTLTYPLGPALVMLNTFGPFILTGAAASLLAVWNITPQAGPDPPSALLYRAFKSSVTVMTFFHALLLASTIAASHLRRHLMVWAIFAPRYMLAASSLLAVDFGCLVFGFGYASVIVFRKNRVFFGTEYM